MVISSNPKPDQSEFRKLLNKTVLDLKKEAQQKPKTYLKLLGRDLESAVHDIMSDNARGTDFDNTIELISGQKFPDIIAMKYFGVEVKTSKLDHWITTGNSIMEGTRVDGIERIFMLFGKMVEPIEFKCRPYEECLSEVVVTHSPRYQIDMNLNPGESIFERLNIPYDTLRKSSNPFKPIIEYYKQFLKPGEEVWWLDQEGEKNKSLIIKAWNNLPIEKKNEYMVKAMILFPEVFSNSPDKYNRFSVWLVNTEGVVCSNIRDVFSAGGQGELNWNGQTYRKIPKIIIKLIDKLPEIKALIKCVEHDELVRYWGSLPKNRYNHWIGLISENTKTMNLTLNLKKYLTTN